MPDTGELTVSGDTLEQLQERAARSNFETADAYADFVLAEVLHRLAEQPDAPDIDSVTDRLQSLGYVE